MADLERLKVSANVWDSDRNPRDYAAWQQNVGAMVSVLKAGPPLEAWLDLKLQRKRAQSMITPSFLLDESWDFSDDSKPVLSPAERAAARAEEREAAIHSAAADAAEAAVAAGMDTAAVDAAYQTAANIAANNYDELHANDNADDAEAEYLHIYELPDDAQYSGLPAKSKVLWMGYYSPR